MQSRTPSPENDIFSLSIVPQRDNKAAGTTSTDFDGFLERPLLLHEDLKDGCGGQLWPAGMTLAKYLLKYQHDLQGKSVLEIGAGGGLVGLAIASGCFNSDDRKVIITDQIPMRSLMQKNIALNGLEERVVAEVYDWGSPMPAAISSQLESAVETADKHPDILVAADCVYFEPAFPLLLRTLTDLIGASTVCYFCFKRRRKADMRFVRGMNKTFNVEEVDYEDIQENKRSSVFLYKLTAKKETS